MSSAVVRVLIADDHPVVRGGIKGMLEPDPGFAVVGEASSGLEAVALALREHPDVVLMDLQMPGLDGASATAQIKAQLPQTQVLVLTTYAADAPSRPGICRSISTTSGCSRSARATASGPLDASPATSNPGSGSSIPLIPLRTTG